MKYVYNLTRMATLKKNEAKEIRLSDEYYKTIISRRNITEYHYIKINLLNNHHLKIHDGKSIMSCKICIIMSKIDIFKMDVNTFWLQL